MNHKEWDKEVDMLLRADSEGKEKRDIPEEWTYASDEMMKKRIKPARELAQQVVEKWHGHKVKYCDCEYFDQNCCDLRNKLMYIESKGFSIEHFNDLRNGCITKEENRILVEKSSIMNDSSMYVVPSENKRD